jgi:hypothetical protein
VEMVGTPRAGAGRVRTPEEAADRWSRAVAELERRGRPPADVLTWAKGFGAHLQSSLDAARAGRTLSSQNRGMLGEIDRQLAALRADAGSSDAVVARSRALEEKQKRFERQLRAIMDDRRRLYRELQALAQKYQWKPPPELADSIEQAAK